MTAMLLLGLAEVPRSQIEADYLYSFASVAEVNRIVFDHERPASLADRWNPLPSRKEAIEFMLDRIEGGYGSTRAYLEACGLDAATIEAVRAMLLEPSDAGQ